MRNQTIADLGWIKAYAQLLAENDMATEALRTIAPTRIIDMIEQIMEREEPMA